MISALLLCCCAPIVVLPPVAEAAVDEYRQSVAQASQTQRQVMIDRLLKLKDAAVASDDFVTAAAIKKYVDNLPADGSLPPTKEFKLSEQSLGAVELYRTEYAAVARNETDSLIARLNTIKADLASKEDYAGATAVKELVDSLTADPLYLLQPQKELEDVHEDGFNFIVRIDAEGKGTVLVEYPNHETAVPAKPTEKAELPDGLGLGLGGGPRPEKESPTLLYDFSTMKDLSPLAKLSRGDANAEKAFARCRLDSEHKVLVMDTRGGDSWISLPNMFRTPFEINFSVHQFTVGFFKLNITAGTHVVRISMEKKTADGPMTLLLRYHDTAGPTAKRSVTLKEVKVPTQKTSEVPFQVPAAAAQERVQVGFSMSGEDAIEIARIEVIADLVPMIGMKFEMKQNQVVVAHIIPGMAADGAGLRKGDVILQLDGRIIKDLPTAMRIVGNTEIGEKLSVSYERKGKRGRAMVTPE